MTAKYVRCQIPYNMISKQKVAKKIVENFMVHALICSTVGRERVDVTGVGLSSAPRFNDIFWFILLCPECFNNV